MSENKPENMVELLFNQRSGTNKEILIKVNPDGKIAEVLGNHQHFSHSGVKPGITVSETFPFLNIFFPATEPNSVNLPHINWGKLYVNVQILTGENLETWILFSDVTHEVREVEENIQQDNNFALKHKIKKLPFENPFGNLHLFDVASFLKTKEDKFIPLGNSPLWLERYFPQLGSTINAQAILETFPYLEVFFPEAESFWKTEEETLMGSDMWIESPSDNVELHIRAFAANKNRNHYLLMRLLDHDDIPISQRTIQKAREHQLLYEKLEKAEKELKLLLYYKDKFVSIVSHDLRSPMASVVSIAEMLLTDKELLSSMSDFNREMLQSMKEELLRLLEYNNRLYHWSNLELGNFKLEPEKISIKKLINSVSQTALSKIEAKSIQYISDVPEDFEIEVDVSLFTQALNNLIGNAIKFTPENGTIKTGARRGEGKPQFFVSDSGVGMSEKTQKSIFAGVPNESTLGTAGEKGSGLGLDIVMKIIDAHGFTIEVQSEEGKGTTFIISL
jgi:signal transduction histidine kinase